MNKRFCEDKFNSVTFCAREPGHELPHTGFDPLNLAPVCWPVFVRHPLDNSPTSQEAGVTAQYEEKHGIPVNLDDRRAVLAARLRTGRRAIGLTQQDVADALQIPRSAVADLESGKRKLYSLELRQIARLYRRPVDWLLGAEEPLTLLDDACVILQDLSESDRQAVLDFARFLAHQTDRSKEG